MDGNLISFYVLAIVAVGSALGMLLNKNSVYSALFLILNFATVAIYYLMLGAPFIAMAQVTVYAGAIMVLFLFVIMLLGAEQIAGDDQLSWQKPVSWILTGLLVLNTLYLLFGRGAVDGENALQAFPSGFGSPESIGEELFTKYLLPFEVASVLLLVAMIGAIVLTKREINKRSAAKSDEAA